VDRGEAKRVQQARQPWQLEAWAYRRSLGELRYATSYLGNSASRMRLMPAVYMEGQSEPTELTINNAADLGIPEDLVLAAGEALNRLASGGPLAISAILRKMTENFEVAGECYLIGRVDEDTGVEKWDIRSVTEVDVQGSKVVVKETPTSRIGEGAEALDLGTSTFIRMWWPDPQFAGLADSPVRAVLDICEELLLIGRDVRATARNRVSNNGILFMPEELSIIPVNAPGAEQDPRMDPFLAEFMASITTAIQNEGSAGAVAPMLVRGPAEAGVGIRHILLNRPANAFNIQQRQELISRMATGIDLPSEVLTGKVDLNHWTAWQVDDDTFRHHIEPIVVVECDALTQGFMWPQLDALNLASKWDPAVVRRIICWYDPTSLVTHPDRSKDAFEAWDRMAISDEALRKYLGFPNGDAPASQELLLRMATKLRTLDPSVQVQILKRLDPTLKDAPAATPGPPAGGGEPVPSPPPPSPPSDGPPAGGQPDPSAESGARVDMADIWRRLAAAHKEAAALQAAGDVVDETLDRIFT
jgi:hypothetical protein